MPKPFPILIFVEDIAAGAIMRKLHEMPGVVDLGVPWDMLGEGGMGAGRKQLEKAVAEKRISGADHTKAVIQMLMQGPKNIREISAAIGGKISRAYGIMTKLRKDGFTESIGKGGHQLTAKARSRLGGATPAALPPPRKVKGGPAGRAAPGSGQIILRSALGAGPASPTDLRKQLAEQGMSAKSISGVLDRGRKRGLIKKNGSDLYELTAKGLKIELGAHANG